MNNERTKECDTQFIVEEGESGFGAARAGFARLRCSSGDKQGVLKLTQEAIKFHLEGLREDGEPIPPPSSSVEYVEVRAA